MDPDSIPFNALIMGPNQLPQDAVPHEPALLTFSQSVCLHNAHLPNICSQQDPIPFCGERPAFLSHHLPATPRRTLVEKWQVFFLKAPTASLSKDVKLVKLSFSARHGNISVWLLTQQLSSIANAKLFCDNMVAIVLFYTNSAKTTKVIFAG